MYEKPHLSYEEQLDLLVGRGIEYEDREVRVNALRKIGYYRLSAYSYPFREMLPETERTSSTNFRSDNFIPGTRFETVMELAEFDSKFRRLMFEALENIEVVLCSRVAYHAGRVDRFIRTNKKALDTDRCNSRVGSKTRWEAWEGKYKSLCHQAKNEDFFKHFEEKYDGEMPIWVVMEFIDFGGLVRLFYLLPSGVQSKVSKTFGVRSGSTFSKWIVGLNYFRNKVAHHNRLWNRKMTYGLTVANKNEVSDDLLHLQNRNSKLRTAYDYVSLIAYLVSHIMPESNWPLKVVSLIDEFPESDHVTPEKDMGFPTGWRMLRLWS